MEVEFRKTLKMHAHAAWRAKAVERERVLFGDAIPPIPKGIV
jgi:hypothetical protein